MADDSPPEESGSDQFPRGSVRADLILSQAAGRLPHSQSGILQSSTNRSDSDAPSNYVSATIWPFNALGTCHTSPRSAVA